MNDLRSMSIDQLHRARAKAAANRRDPYRRARVAKIDRELASRGVLAA